MVRHLLLVPIAAVWLGACSRAHDTEGPVGRSPSGTIFEASEETKRDLGVARWGFDDSGDVTTFRGYDASNAQILELRESVDETEDDFTKRITMQMAGTLGSASATIDVGVVVSEDFQSASYSKKTVENTFYGGPGGKVLAHLSSDALAMARKPVPAAAGVVQARSLQPRAEDAGTSLLDGTSELVECCCELANTAAALSAGAGAACALTPGAEGSGLGRSSIAPLALVREKSGRLRIRSPYKGRYNIVDNHCHHAAAANSSSTDGYIGCDGTSSTTTYSGHTINWTHEPAYSHLTPASPNGFCAYEPQGNDATLLSGGVCCFEDSPRADGVPSLTSEDARACIRELCLGQADFEPGGVPPQAFPVGSKPPVPNDCTSSTGSLFSCNACCTDYANFVRGEFDDPDSRLEIADYRKRCAASCQQAETVRNPPPPTDPCAASVLHWLQQRAERAATCEAK